jgi:hypothetical protein
VQVLVEKVGNKVVLGVDKFRSPPIVLGTLDAKELQKMDVFIGKKMAPYAGSLLCPRGRMWPKPSLFPLTRVELRPACLYSAILASVNFVYILRSATLSLFRKECNT